MSRATGSGFFAARARATLVAGATLALACALAAQTDDPFRNTTNIPTPVRPPRAAVFFPPFPPPLDQIVNRHQPPAAGRNVAPPELADFVTEVFYPQLSTLFATRALTEKQRGQLAEYRGTKQRLLRELRAQLAAQAEAEPAARRAALEAFARRQAPALIALEQTAELLRAELIAPDRNWSDYREWRLGDRERRGYSPYEIATVMRAYAHYHKGLLPAQRQLLREIAVELALAIDVTDKSASASAPPHVFFSPHVARAVMPDMSPEIATKFAAYLTKKSGLKKELYDAVYNFDGKGSLFNNPLKKLVEKQAPHLAELERLADEIRVGLDLATALAPPPDPAARSALPGSYITRLTELMQRRNVLQRESTAKVDAIIARNVAQRAPVTVRYAFENDVLRFAVYPAMRGTPPAKLEEKLESVRTELSAVAEDFARGIAELLIARDVIRREAAQSLGQTDLTAADAALAVLMRAAAARETESPYREYRIAMFQPGLSPEQRRLLFDGAVEQLGLPLPRGDLQPQRRANSW